MVRNLLNNSINLRYLQVFCCLALLILALPGQARGQQIVTDANLNQMLISFQQGFDSNPQLTEGATPLIQLKGTEGKVSFDFQQRGQYVFDYGEVSFTATNPISANRFTAQLLINKLTLIGDGNVIITVKNKSYDIPCRGNQFAVGPVDFSVQVEVNPAGEIILTNMQTVFDPNNTQVSVPCLQPTKTSLQAAGNLDSITRDELVNEARAAINDRLTRQFTQLLQEELNANKKVPKGVLNAAGTGVKKAATSPTSSVSMTSNVTAMKTCMAVTSLGSSTCGSAVLPDLQNVLASLAALSTSSNRDAFRTALTQFATNLRQLLPTLDADGQQTVVLLIAALQDAIIDGQLSDLEQQNLLNDLFNLVINSGITATQLNMIRTDLLNQVSAIPAVSIMQLTADLDKLVVDAQACLQP